MRGRCRCCSCGIRLLSAFDCVRSPLPGRITHRLVLSTHRSPADHARRLWSRTCLAQSRSPPPLPFTVILFRLINRFVLFTTRSFNVPRSLNLPRTRLPADAHHHYLLSLPLPLPRFRISPRSFLSVSRASAAILRAFSNFLILKLCGLPVPATVHFNRLAISRWG